MNKKTYLDLFLENSVPKKRERYFENEQEAAILKYNNSLDQTEKNKIFAEVIDTCFKKTVLGVLEMAKFRHLPKALDREELIDQAYFRLVEKIYHFKDGMISKKTGLPVKAFSYFSTIAKNYVLEQIKKHNKIIHHKADVEHSIDLTILSEETLSKMSQMNIFNEVVLGDYVSNFIEAKKIILNVIKNLIIEEESNEKQDEDFIKLGYCLKYLLEKWDKIEFVKKNEFMRILTLYTNLNQQKVSFLFKKFKVAVLAEIKPGYKNLKKKPSLKEDDEEVVLSFLEEDSITEDGEDDIERDFFLEPLTESEKLMSYEINSLDDFELREMKLDNINERKEWKTRLKSKVQKKS